MDLTYTRNINAPLSTVINAASTLEGIKGWWALNCEITGDIMKVAFHFPDLVYSMTLQIEDNGANNTARWRCIEHVNPAWLDTLITFQFSGDSSSSVVTFTHSGFAPDYDNSIAHGKWDMFMDSYKKFCETGIGEPLG